MDSGWPHPDGGSFTVDRFRLDAEGDRVAFIHRETSAGGLSTRRGVWLSDGLTFVLVADTATLVPGGTETFLSFGEIVLLEDGVAFLAGDSAGGAALYRWSGGSTSLWLPLDFLGASPELRVLKAFRSGVALASFSSTDPMLIFWVDGAGTRQIVAREGDSAPGGGTFTDFRALETSVAWVVFEARTTLGEGLFAWEPEAGLRAVVDQDTLLPGLGPYEQAERFQGWQSTLSVRDSQVAFVQNQNVAPSFRCRGGVFVWELGRVQKIADNTDLSPTDGESLECFYDVHFGPRELWLRASTDSIIGGPSIPMRTPGEVLRRDGEDLVRILGPGDEIDGAQIFTHQPLVVGDRAVILIDFYGSPPFPRNEPGIFELTTAGVPSPVPGLRLSGVGLLVLLVGWAGSRLLR